MSLFWTLLVIILVCLGVWALFVRIRFGTAGAGYGAPETKPAAALKATAAKVAEPAKPQAQAPSAPKATQPEPPKPAPAAVPATPAGDGVPALPAAKGAPDDLKQISGVGPKLEQKLNGIGVTQFQQIAAFTPEHIAYVDGKLAFKGRIERDDWIGQAKALSQGG